MNTFCKFASITSLLVSVSPAFAQSSNYPTSPAAGTQRGPQVVLPQTSSPPPKPGFAVGPLPQTSNPPPPKGTVSGGATYTIPLPTGGKSPGH